MKILVLGGGAQGSVIAHDLARSLPAARVQVADMREPALEPLGNLGWIEADLSDPAAVARLLHDHDLGVGALPSRLGWGAMSAAIDARRNLVDVSFSAEDPLALDAAARAARVTIAPDCGLAPGLSNLVVGAAVEAHGAPDELTIYVGGVAADASAPYGYVVTWSVDDLLEEYTRPARIVRGGRPVTVPVFSGLEQVEVEGIGTMEAFYSDGLRTLIHTLPGVPEMGEKTLRWPGHAAQVQPLVAGGRLRQELLRRCSVTPARDLVGLEVRMRWGARERVVTMVDRFDPTSGLTAMARTTAFTTSVVAQLAAQGGLDEPGVQPLERVGRGRAAHDFIAASMAARGVRLLARG
jgi:lysine 6-dehydrogenase